MAFNKILGPPCGFSLAAITRYAPCVSLAAKELPIWYENVRANLALRGAALTVETSPALMEF